MPKTIHEHPLVTSAAAADELLIWRTASSDTKRIAKSNLLGGSLTGGGVIATGGFTLTVPATGVAALQNVAQTWSTKQTFGAGIDFGQGSVLDYYQAGAWTPVVADAAASGHVATATRVGTYIRIGRLVTVFGSLININTAAPIVAANPIYVLGLPFPCLTFTNYFAPGSAYPSRFTFPGFIVPILLSGNSYLNFSNPVTGATPESLTLFSDVAASTLSDIHFTLSYLIDS